MFDILFGDYLESVEKLKKSGETFQLILVNQKKNVGFLSKLYDSFEAVLDDNATVFLYSNSEMLETLIEHATNEGDNVLTVFDDTNEVAKACFKTKRNITTLVPRFSDRKEKEIEFNALLKGGEKPKEKKINHSLF